MRSSLARANSTSMALRLSTRPRSYGMLSPFKPQSCQLSCCKFYLTYSVCYYFIHTEFAIDINRWLTALMEVFLAQRVICVMCCYYNKILFTYLFSYTIWQNNKLPSIRLSVRLLIHPSVRLLVGPSVTPIVLVHPSNTRSGT